MRAIRSERLRLSPVTAQNAALLWALLQRPDLRTYQDLPNVGAPAFAEMVARRPQRLRRGANGRFEWLVHLARVRQPVGWVSLRIGDRQPETAEIGYTLLRDYRGRGIAVEAVSVLLAEAFDAAGLSRIVAYCVPENAASRRLLERAGFSYETVMPHGATVSGRPVDVLVHGLSRERWHQRGNSIVMPASAYPA